MRVVPYQEVLKEKLDRQEKLLEKGAEKHADGHCFHLGKISPGCRRCFTSEVGAGIQIGNLCMYKCSYCYYDPERKEQPQTQIDDFLSNFFYNSLDPNNRYKGTIFAFQSSGETLIYIDQLEKFALILDQISQKTKINHYRFLYTNGVLAKGDILKRMQENLGVNEIRFHLSASNFSKEVYNNMEEAAKMGFFITVEEPSYPLHREKLFEMLPILDSVGGKHLDMVEVQISDHNYKGIGKDYPEDKWRVFKDYFYHFYDEGLVYDIMEEVIDKKYGFSVIDCNSAVERCRQAKANQPFRPRIQDLKGMCADWDYGFEELNS